MAKSASITKTEAIKRAIEAGATLPTEGVAYIKKHFGLDVATGFFSTVKGELANQRPVKAVPASAPVAVTGSAGKSAVMPKPAPSVKSSVMRRPATAAKSSVLPKPAPAVKSIDPLAFAREVKGLVDRYGVDAVKGMADIVKG